MDECIYMDMHRRDCNCRRSCVRTYEYAVFEEKIYWNGLIHHAKGNKTKKWLNCMATVNIITMMQRCNYE